MAIVVSDAAIALYRNEWDFKSGDRIRIYPRYGGGGANPFSIGIAKSAPADAALTATIEGVTFFMERDDVWLLEGSDLRIDAKGGEIVYEFGL
ncbi:Fe-S cluster assembly protein HesB [Paenibacillus sp. TRM 82003]|nr:Fe-S cluster assembly protein HesB [Paenibacillus sp. TRM 82003]